MECLCFCKIKFFHLASGFPGGSAVKNLPAMWEMWVQYLGREDPLEEGMETHSSILAWRIPWTEEPGGQQSMVSQRVGRDRATKHRYSTDGLFQTERCWKRIRNSARAQLCTPVLSGLTGCCPLPSIRREHHPPCLTGPGKDQIQNLKHGRVSLSHWKVKHCKVVKTIISKAWCVSNTGLISKTHKELLRFNSLKKEN